MGVKLNKNLNMRGFHPQGQQLMVPEVTRLRIISKKKKYLSHVQNHYDIPWNTEWFIGILASWLTMAYDSNPYLTG